MSTEKTYNLSPTDLANYKHARRFAETREKWIQEFLKRKGIAATKTITVYLNATSATVTITEKSL